MLEGGVQVWDLKSQIQRGIRRDKLRSCVYLWNSKQISRTFRVKDLVKTNKDSVLFYFILYPIE